jgi:type III secretion protein C
VTFKKVVKPLIFAACLMLSFEHSVAYAQQSGGAIPFPDKTISINARGEPVNVFLQDLFGQANLRVKISSSVKDPVRGIFPGSPRAIWNQISKVYNLVGYYDGSVVRVYSANEIKSTIISTANPNDLVREVTRQGMLDPFNSVRAGKNSVTVSGVPFFVDRVGKMAMEVGPKEATIIPVSSTTTASLPATTDIISPMASGSTAASTTQTRLPLRSELLEASGPRQPYEARIFYLRYSDALDKTVNTLAGPVVYPGIVSQLREIMGDGRSSNSGSSQYRPYQGSGQNGTSIAPVVPDVGSRQRRGYGQPPVVIQEAPTRDVNGARFQAVPNLNAVIIRDKPQAMRTYEGLITGLDIEQPSIEIEATIINLNTNVLKERGLDINIRTGGLLAVLGGPSAAPAEGFSSPNVSATYTTGRLNVFGAQITLLEKTGYLQVVQKARAVTLDNIPYLFTNVSRYNTKVEATEDAQLFVQSFGLALQVKPSIINDGGVQRIRMEVSLEDGQSLGVDASGSPIVQEQKLSTNTAITQGESLIIGGMTVLTNFDNKSKTPGLGDIPGIGELFKKRSKGGARIEKIIILTPRIMGRGVPAQQALAPVEEVQGVKLKSKKTSKKKRGGSA